MGKISQGILGGVSGTVGNVVGSSWKGINYLRVKADHFKDAKSDGQVKQRLRFAACTALAISVMDAIIKPIWNRKAVKMTGYNLFVKTNLPVFDEAGEITDYNKLKFSTGDLPLPSVLVIEDDAAAPGGIVISWTDNSGIGIAAPTDQLKVLAMCNGELSILQGLEFSRDALSANIVLPFGSGAEVHVYAFFENVGKTKYSTDKHALVAVS